MKSLMRSIVLIAFAGMPSGSLSAQGNSTNTIKNCNEAARFVENGHPAHKQEAALQYLMRCGQTGAAATVIAVSQSGGESDLNSLAHFYWTVDGWRDSSVMLAVMRVAQDPAASIPSRVFAMIHLLRLRMPNLHYSYQKAIEGVDVNHLPCVAGLSSPDMGGFSVGQPLPAGFNAQIDAVLRQLMANTSAPPEVQKAASCVLAQDPVSGPPFLRGRPDVP